jgi:hypothetical protein
LLPIERGEPREYRPSSLLDLHEPVSARGLLDLFEASEEVDNTGDLQRVVHLQAALFVFDYARRPQHRQVPGDSRGVGADHGRKLADTVFAMGELIDNKQSGGVGYGLDNAGAGFVAGFGLFVHRAAFRSYLLFGKIDKYS